MPANISPYSAALVSKCSDLTRTPKLLNCMQAEDLISACNFFPQRMQINIKLFVYMLFIFLQPQPSESPTEINMIRTGPEDWPRQEKGLPCGVLLAI